MPSLSAVDRLHDPDADGGVIGTLAGVTSTFAYLDPTPTYDAGIVDLPMVRPAPRSRRQEVPFCFVERSPGSRLSRSCAR